MSEPATTNVTEYSVSQISAELKRAIEDGFGYVRVRGEISGYRGPHSSGHAYFSLKDDKARIEAVIWKLTFMRMKVKPEEGMEVIVTGRITTYPGKSSYQIVIDALEPAGIGALMVQLEERRRRLAAEGLFDAARKKPLPYLPRVIGVITSPTGAVIRDILHRLADRFPVQVVLWPVAVQGERCAPEVAAAIRGFNALAAGGAISRPDVIIVARGGGSLEDLLGFSDEAVVRAAAGSAIPLISAVGHETDTTLIDFAADRRAPTPTGAAEMAVPVRSELLATLDGCARRHSGAIGRLFEMRRRELRAATRAMPTLENLLAVPRRTLDEAATRLGNSLVGHVMAHRTALAQVAGRLSIGGLERSLARHADRLGALRNPWTAGAVTDTGAQRQARRGTRPAAAVALLHQRSRPRLRGGPGRSRHANCIGGGNFIRRYAEHRAPRRPGSGAGDLFARQAPRAQSRQRSTRRPFLSRQRRLFTLSNACQSHERHWQLSLTGSLVKAFARDEISYTDQRRSMQRTMTIAVGSIFVAAAVLALKLVAWWLTGSIALFSDALESIVNVVTAIATLAALRVSAMPADANHPYGHQKAEYIWAVLEGALIIVAALLIFRAAVDGILSPMPLNTRLDGLAFNAAAAVLNGFWATVLMRRARQMRSPALQADARHLFTDVISSVGVLAGLIVARLTGFEILDPLLAALVGLAILWSGWTLLRGSVGGLMDEAVEPPRLEQIRTLIAGSAKGAIEAHDLRTRHAGRTTFLDFHLVVPGSMSVSEAHEICDRIERALQKDTPGAVVSIHVEPDDKAKHSGIVVL